MKSLLLIFGLIFVAHCHVIKRDAPPQLADDLKDILPSLEVEPQQELILTEEKKVSEEKLELQPVKNLEKLEAKEEKAAPLEEKLQEEPQKLEERLKLEEPLKLEENLEKEPLKLEQLSKLEQQEVKLEEKLQQNELLEEINPQLEEKKSQLLEEPLKPLELELSKEDEPLKITKPEPQEPKQDEPLKIELEEKKQLLESESSKVDEQPQQLLEEKPLKVEEISERHQLKEDIQIPIEHLENLRLDPEEIQNSADESDGLRQNTGGSTQRPNIIQQLVQSAQNNPLTNFIQGLRPSSTSQPQADAAVETAAVSSTTQANILQQIGQNIADNFQNLQHNLQQGVQGVQQGLQQGVQGLQQNIQGFINPAAVQSTNTTSRPPIPPFNLITNLFNPQNTSNQASGGSTGGPIQNFLGGIFGGGNNRETQQSTTVAATTTSSTAAPVSNLSSDIVNEQPDPSENEHDIYVGDDENNSIGY